MKNIHMFGISPLNGVKKPLFRPEKWHGFGPGFYYVHDTNDCLNSRRVMRGMSGMPRRRSFRRGGRCAARPAVAAPPTARAGRPTERRGRRACGTALGSAKGAPFHADHVAAQTTREELHLRAPFRRQTL